MFIATNDFVRVVKEAHKADRFFGILLRNNSGVFDANIHWKQTIGGKQESFSRIVPLQNGFKNQQVVSGSFGVRDYREGSNFAEYYIPIGNGVSNNSILCHLAKLIKLDDQLYVHMDINDDGRGVAHLELFRPSPKTGKLAMKYSGIISATPNPSGVKRAS